MADAEAKALIHAADKDGNQGIDFNEFAKFWETLHGESDVRLEIVMSTFNFSQRRPSGRSFPRLMRIKVAILLKVSNGNKCVHEFANVKVKRTHCPYNFATLRAHQLTFPSSSCFFVGDVTKF